MNKQQLRRLGVLPYEDTPNSRHVVEEQPWFTADGTQRVMWPRPARGAGRTQLPQMVIERTEIEPRERHILDGWTTELAETRVFGLMNWVDRAAEQLTITIDEEAMEFIRRGAIDDN